uniref:Putative secreted protein n=1 Tax=Anopheles darlingi TaxID=43151 RepID=A0A2M4D7K9_ANODA
MMPKPWLTLIHFKNVVHFVRSFHACSSCLCTMGGIEPPTCTHNKSVLIKSVFHRGTKERGDPYVCIDKQW